MSINQLLRNSSPARQLDLGEFNFLKCATLLIPVPIWARFMAIKMQKVCTTWSFPSHYEDEIQWETCWHVWQIYRAINSLNADTATRVDFTTKFYFWFLFSQFLIYPLVWIAPFLKENQQLSDADDARCIGSQTDIVSSKHSKHSTPAITPSPRCTETQSQWNYFENWRSHERLSDKSMPSCPHFSLEFNWKSPFARRMLQSLLDRKDHLPPPTNPRYDQETFFRILDFLI